MRRTVRNVAAVMICLVALVMGAAWAQDQKAQTKKAATDVKKESGPAFLYVGVKGCKMCHKSKKSGNQFGVWSSAPHAKAYATLGTEESVAIAKELGLKSAPQEAPECLRCHSTACGLKKDEVKGTLNVEDGVQCESCHGPGSAYKSLKIMKDHAKSVEAGLWEISEDLCLKCHNKQSPTFKEFDYKTALAKIAHPIPAPASAEKSSEGAK